MYTQYIYIYIYIYSIHSIVISAIISVVYTQYCLSFDRDVRKKSMDIGNHSHESKTVEHMCLVIFLAIVLNKV